MEAAVITRRPWEGLSPGPRLTALPSLPPRVRIWAPHSNRKASFIQGQKADGRKRKTGWRGLMSTESEQSASSKVEELLSSVRVVIGLDKLPSGSLVSMRGNQELMATRGKWELFFTPHGEFAEAYLGPDYGSILASDGTIVWETDAAGRVSQLDLDDLEVSMLAAWLKSGFWASQEASKHLHVSLLTTSDWKFLQGLQGPLRLAADTSGFEFLAVSLRGRKACMYVVIDMSTWLPHAAVFKAYGTAALAKLENWTRTSAEPSLQLPMHSSFLRDSGDIVSTSVTSVEILRPSTDGDGKPKKYPTIAAQQSLIPRDSMFGAPPANILPVPLEVYPIATLDSSAVSEIEALATPSGHILVRPLINNQDVGYFILDTGASTLTIEPDVADKLGLRKFGCVHTVTVNGPAQCSFREGHSFSLGPLKISNPRFVDVAGASLAERDLPVAGICGFDVFYHCRVHVTRGNKRGKVKLRFLDPRSPVDEDEFTSAGVKVSWLPMRMLSGTPHVTMQFRANAAAALEDALFLLDTGAAGSDLIFNSVATGQYGLWPQGNVNGGGLMRGMGAGGASASEQLVTHRNLAEVVLTPGISVKNASAIVMAPNQPNGLQLSVYTAGLVCQNLLRPFDLIIDYANRRMGIIPQKRQGMAGHGKWGG